MREGNNKKIDKHYRVFHSHRTKHRATIRPFPSSCWLPDRARSKNTRHKVAPLGSQRWSIAATARNWQNYISGCDLLYLFTISETDDWDTINSLTDPILYAFMFTSCTKFFAFFPCKNLSCIVLATFFSVQLFAIPCPFRRGRPESSLHSFVYTLDWAVGNFFFIYWFAFARFFP